MGLNGTDGPPSGLPPISPSRGEIGQSQPPRFVEAEWPEAEFIVGNPTFLGGKKLRDGLGDDYVGTLFAVYDERVPRVRVRLDDLDQFAQPRRHPSDLRATATLAGGESWRGRRGAAGFRFLSRAAIKGPPVREGTDGQRKRG